MKATSCTRNGRSRRLDHSSCRVSQRGGFNEIQAGNQERQFGTQFRRPAIQGGPRRALVHGPTSPPQYPNSRSQNGRHGERNLRSKKSRKLDSRAIRSIKMKAKTLPLATPNRDVLRPRNPNQGRHPERRNRWRTGRLVHLQSDRRSDQTFASIGGAEDAVVDDVRVFAISN